LKPLIDLPAQATQFISPSTIIDGAIEASPHRRRRQRSQAQLSVDDHRRPY